MSAPGDSRPPDPPAPPGAPASGRARRLRWEAISALIALASVTVALIFSAYQLRSSADAQNQSRRATELQLLTQLDSGVADAMAQISGPEFLADAEDGQLTETTRTRLRRALRKLDFLAYLFNGGHISLPGAREQWLSDMSCAWLTGTNYLPEERMQQFTELRRATSGEECTGPFGRFPVP